MTKICPHCKSEIDYYATKCPFCTSELPQRVYTKEDDYMGLWIICDIVILVIFLLIGGFENFILKVLGSSFLSALLAFLIQNFWDWFSHWKYSWIVYLVGIALFFFFLFF